MELFERAKAVRLRSHHDKYLYADEDESHVTQDRSAAGSPNARWLVELVPHSPGVIRLRSSSHGRYLTASNEPFLIGLTGRKVVQTLPHRLNSSVEWVPGRNGNLAFLRTRYGNYLRANCGVPPLRNSVTHDVTNHRHPGWILWTVEVVQNRAPESSGPAASSSPEHPAQPHKPPSRPPTPSPSPYPTPLPTAALRPLFPPLHRAENLPPFRPQPPPPPPGYIGAPPAGLSRLESTDSFSVPLPKVEGRFIYYLVGDDNGNVREGEQGHSFTFNGTCLEELLGRLQEESGLKDVIICLRSPINGKLLPLRLQLPPNNNAMHVVLVRESSTVAKSFQ